MAVLAFLRRLVVVGRSSEDRVYSRARRSFLRFRDCFVSGIRGGAGNYGNASGREFDSDIDYIQPLVVCERRRFTRCAAGDEEVDSGFNLPGDQIAQGSVVNCGVLTKGSEEDSTTASAVPANKITRSR